jgi:endoribonuclease Dicer
MKQRIIALFTQDSSISSNKDMFIVDPGPLEWDFTDNDNFVPPSAEVVELDALLAKYIFLFSDPDRPETIPVDVPLEWCTPQIHKLVDLLSEHYTQSFQGIVFVEQRHVAMALARILPRIPQLHGKIKSAELVGHGAAVSSRAQLKGMGIQNQQDVVRMFREGDLNLRESPPPTHKYKHIV